jgi:hypothetical protein
MSKSTKGWGLLIQLGLLFTAANAFALVPPAPRNIVAPSGTLIATTNMPVSVTVRWFQTAILQVGVNASATHFVVCARAPGIVCTWPAGAQPGVFASPVTNGTLTRTPVYSGSPFGPRIITGYNFSMTVSLGNTEFDAPLQWSVAACAAVAANVPPTPSTCVSGNGPQVIYVAKDLTAQAHMHVQQGALFVTGQAANIGSTRSGPFWSTIRTTGAALNRSGRCMTDPLEFPSGGVFNRDVLKAVTQDGQLIRVGDYASNGGYNFGALIIVAIVSPFTGLVWADASAQATLEPNGNIASPELVVDMQRPISDFQPITDRTSPFGVVTYTRVDTNSQIPEINEGNNGWGECSVFFP